MRGSRRGPARRSSMLTFAAQVAAASDESETQAGAAALIWARLITPQPHDVYAVVRMRQYVCACVRS